MTTALAIDYLPESLRDVGDFLGMEAAMALLDKFAGIRLFIPKHVGVEHFLSQKLGHEAAQKLSRIYGGETLTIPRAVRAKRRLRNLAIVAHYDRGASVRQLAGEYQLTERQIYTILSATAA